ncbi:MAG: excinuclease ABC subunit UvrB [Promethearchaeota archaeon]
MVSDYKPKGDQPTAIKELVEGIRQGKRFQTLLGATGTGKSIDSEETIIIINENREIHKYHIGDFVDRILTSPKISGNTEYQNCSGYQIYSLNISTNQIELKEIYQVSRHKENAIYKITLDDKSSIKVTKDHNCYRFKNCEFNLSSTSELKIGDYLPLSNVIPVPAKKMEFINLLDYNENFKVNINLFLKKNLQFEKAIHDFFQKEFRAYNWKLNQIKEETKERGITSKQFHELCNLLGINLSEINKQIRIIAKGKDVLNPLIKIDDDFLTFSGMYISEGHATHQGILISTSNENLQNTCKRFFNKLKLNYIQRNENDIYFSSVILSNFFKIFGRSAYKKHIPSLFYNLSNDQLQIFLRAIFDGDGWVQKESVLYLSASQELIADLKNLLLRFDITSRISVRKIKYKQELKIYHKLSISGKNNLQIFKNKINFSLQYKRDKLNNCIKSTHNTNVDIIPNCGEYLKKLRTKLNLSQKDIANKAGCIRQHISMIERNKRRPSKEIFVKIIEFDENYDKLRNLEYINLRRIIEIQKLETSNGFVYDLSVKDNNNFAAGIGNIFVHNTYTIANVIAQVNLPTLVMAPNKLLAAQLYQEFKDFFPYNSVHYYISYFDYYQPEAYLPAKGMYIEKDSSVNEEIMKYRLASTYALMTRQDVIVVASVSCIYGIGNPKKWARKSIIIEKGMKIDRRTLMKKLISINFERNDIDFSRGKIRVRGDVVDIFPGYLDVYYRVSLFGDEIDEIYEMNPITNEKIQEFPNLKIFPTSEYVTVEDLKDKIIKDVFEELEERLEYFKSNKKWAEAQRLEERVRYDMEMMREMGYCSGIENYSRFLDQREPGETPACLYDYFPKKFLLVMDESHIGIPQIHGMIKGDQARKKNLVDYGFRLPSALDNRPLRFDEWEKKLSHVICTSATPGPYELKRSGGKWVDQVIRPTGLVDPEVEIRPVEHQIDDLLDEIRLEIKKGNRILVTTLTKRMAENIAEYYADLGLKIEYLHSDIDTVERMELIRELRQGKFDVLIGINLLREGLDLPEVGLVAILDGDKEGFLRDTRSLIQTIGRASRNANGRVIIYADKITRSIEAAVRETDRRRKKQIEYNKKHGITPQTIKKRVQESLSEYSDEEEKPSRTFKSVLHAVIEKNKNEEDILKNLEIHMLEAAKELEFERAAMLRDLIKDIKEGGITIEKIKESILNGQIDIQGKTKIRSSDSQDYSGFQILGTIEHISKRDFDRVKLKKKTTKKRKKRRK